MGRAIIAAFLVSALGWAVAQDALSARRKFRLIESDRAPRGSKVTLRQDELNAYVRQEARAVAPGSIREPRLELGQNRATGYAYVDFEKLQKARGEPMGWLASRLLGGERHVRVDAQIRSSGGTAVVDVERVEVSGVAISGRALDYLIRNFLWNYYPDAKVGRPFELAHNIDRLEVRPAQVHVVFAR